MKNITLQIDDKKNHLISTNEGSAVAFAVGYYLAMKKICCVYMQNSGWKCNKPIELYCSLKVYSIPMLLMIGWRGSQRLHKDEPQHLVKEKNYKKFIKII